MNSPIQNEDSDLDRQRSLGARIVAMAAQHQLHPVDLMNQALDMYEINSMIRVPDSDLARLDQLKGE